MRQAHAWLLPLVLAGCFAVACLQRAVDNPNVIIVSLTTGPNNLDPRVGTDDTSQKISQLIYSSLMTLDDQLRVVPGIAERLGQIDPLTYVATLRQGVRFHDGHELTSADVVYTFRSFLDPSFVSARKGAYRSLAAVDARDRYTVVFVLKEPFVSFPSSLVMPVVPEGAGAELQQRPVGTGPYRFVRYTVDDRVELAPFDEYFGGRPANDGLVMRVIPDEIMRGLELRKGTLDLIINDIGPDIVHQLEDDGLAVTTAPGADYQYIGLNLRDPVLQDVRVRRALAYAIDRQAIVDHLRRGLAIPANGLLPPISWAYTPDVMSFVHDPDRARALLDEAGYPDPRDGNPRLRLTLKVSNIEFNRLQSAVIQQDLRQIGVALDVRTYEFATLYADVLSGNFQMFTLQWVGGALADPDILRQIFHSAMMPPSGFNRGYFNNPEVDRLLDEASRSTDQTQRLRLFARVQRVLAEEVPYISLWTKTNFAVSQPTLAGVRLTPTADFFFLKDVARVRPSQTTH
jgi:peptide/nickel transport system substrate-binding protein